MDLWLDDLNIDQTFPELQWGRALSIDRLTNELAAHLNVPAETIFDTVCTIPSNLVTLIDTPQGWAAIGGFVATALRVVPDGDFMPVLNCWRAARLHLALFWTMLTHRTEERRGGKE